MPKPEGYVERERRPRRENGNERRPRRDGNGDYRDNDRRGGDRQPRRFEHRDNDGYQPKEFNDSLDHNDID